MVGIPALFVAVLFLVAHYSSWWPATCVLLAIVLPALLHLYADGRHRKRFLCFLLSLYWRHIGLVLSVVTIGVVACFTALELLSAGASVAKISRASRSGGGPESERFFRFANSVTGPVQAIWEGLVTFLAGIALVTCIVFEKIYYWALAHAAATTLVLSALYLMWLALTVRELWKDEFDDGNDPRQFVPAPSRNPTDGNSVGGFWFDKDGADVISVR